MDTEKTRDIDCYLYCSLSWNDIEILKQNESNFSEYAKGVIKAIEDSLLAESFVGDLSISETEISAREYYDEDSNEITEEQFISNCKNGNDSYISFDLRVLGTEAIDYEYDSDYDGNTILVTDHDDREYIKCLEKALTDVVKEHFGTLIEFDVCDYDDDSEKIEETIYPEPEEPDYDDYRDYQEEFERISHELDE